MIKKVLTAFPNDRLHESFRNKYESDDTLFFPYEYWKKPIINWQEIDVCLIFIPIKVNNEYIYYSNTWKKFLRSNNSQCQLIDVGFGKTPSSHSYINLFELPDDLNMEPGNAEIEKEPQNLNFGTDMQNKIARFLKGHGQESVVDALHKINRKIHLLKREIDLGEWDFDKILQMYFSGDYVTTQWIKFKTRWSYYLPYFSFTPFCHKFFTIDKKISIIHPFFNNQTRDQNLFYELDVWENFSAIQHTLAELMEHYGGK